MSYSPLLNVKISRPSKHAKTGKSENQREKKKPPQKKGSPCLQSKEMSSAQILFFQTAVLYKENSEGGEKKVSVCVVLHQIPVM